MKNAANRVKALFASYRQMEQRVGVLMDKICGPFCSVCSTPCCRKDICSEARESPFLRAVHRDRVEFSETSGYLGARGCRLCEGRPPVCFAFVCSKILQTLPDETHRWAIACLGDLPDFVGKNLGCRQHAVEISQEEGLDDLKLDKFEKALIIAREALGALESFLQKPPSLGTDEVRILKKIRPFRGAP